MILRVSKLHSYQNDPAYFVTDKRVLGWRGDRVWKQDGLLGRHAVRPKLSVIVVFCTISRIGPIFTTVAITLHALGADLAQDQTGDLLICITEQS